MNKILLNIKNGLLICVLCGATGITLAQRRPEILNTAKTVSDSLGSFKWNDTIQLPWNYHIKIKNYAGSATFISGEELSRFRVPNTSNMLAGRIPGLKTTMNGEEPGFDGSTFLIRGDNSYNSGNPYIYVDNAPVNFAQLDPLEIEQLVVLKDAAANGTYGIRGANKVIAVTTRRGKPYQNQIKFYSQFGLLTPMKSPDFLQAKDYMTLYNETAANDGAPARFSQSQIATYDNADRNIFQYPDVNWYDAVIKPQTTQQKYNLTFSGGSNDVQYFVLLGYMDQGGFYKYGDKNEETLGFNTNVGFRRYNFRSNLDFKINPNLTVALDLSGRLENKNNPGVTDNTIWTAISTYPANLFPMQYGDGKIGGDPQYTRNPFGLITQTGYNRQVNRTLMGTTRVVQNLQKLVPGLMLTGAFSYYTYFNNNEGAVLDFASYQVQQDGTYTQFGTNLPYNFRARTQGQDRMNVFWTKLDYEKKIGNDHDLKTHLGFYQSVQTPAGDDFPYATQGFFGRGYYGFKYKYIAELNLAYNGSENLAPGKRYGFFPSLAAAWIVSEEGFLKDKKIDLLKLRASYGLLGNADFGSAFGTGRNRYLFAGGYQTGASYVFGRTATNVTASRSEGSLANPDVTWETLKSANIGLDVAILKNKIGATIDLFTERRVDILAFPSSLSSLIGIDLKAENVGEVTNKGIDWDVYHNNRFGEFSYSLHAIGSLSKNKIIFQDEVVRPYSYLNRTGLPIGTPFGLEATGFFQNQNEIDNNPVQTFGPVKPGDIKYKDQNNDNRIDIYDEVAIGKPSGNPELYYGGTVELKYKRFDFMVWLQGTGKRSVSVLNGATLGFANGAKPTEFALGRWTPQTALTATYPRLSLAAKNGENNYRASTFWMQNGQYLRLKNIEFGYNLSPVILKKVHLSQARLYVSGFNLYTWSKLNPDYLDPEFMNAGISAYPRSKSFNMGLNVQF